ncbi:protein-tyrosine phosphatase family protein [Streptomyces sp. NBC_01198]|uniref:protein-tyrosine phosphatase family protein n=1 Tax=Streptomyces sp. NBC_01198 TaxID=2903769 RepID=UPI002E1404C9|nr:protein phosphatase [Streptomyces sp. NBC_01198]
MKTRQKNRDVPEPDEPWSEISPCLWMGAHYWTDRAGELQPAVVRGEFDLVVSLFTLAGHGPPPAVEHVVVELPDGPLAPDQIGAVQQLTVRVSAAVRAARSVLVRCHSGYNRSGLVVGQALIDLGSDPSAAVDLIRQKRSPWALNNEVFEQYLTAGLDVAYLLTGLEPLR